MPLFQEHQSKVMKLDSMYVYICISYLEKSRHPGNWLPTSEPKNYVKRQKKVAKKAKTDSKSKSARIIF